MAAWPPLQEDPRRKTRPRTKRKRCGSNRPERRVSARARRLAWLRTGMLTWVSYRPVKERCCWRGTWYLGESLSGSESEEGEEEPPLEPPGPAPRPAPGDEL